MSNKKDRPSSDSSKSNSDLEYIVGVGASAGGLEAHLAIFSGMSPTQKMAFVVVQHLAPQHQSRLVELIGHATPLKVQEIRDGIVPKAGTIYVTPPNKDVFLIKGALRLKTPHFKVGPKPSIDLFLQSLAEDAQEKAVGIILSGTGTDGSHGVRAIKAEGGLSICQKLETAKYDGMPKAAKLTGLVDLELTPDEIVQELMEMDRSDGKLIRKRILSGDSEQGNAQNNTRSRSLGAESYDDPYFEVLAILEREVGANFSQYKSTTIRRRMDRRVVATRSGSLAGYVEYLHDMPDEARHLFQDILISVTAFLRDPEAFRALNQKLVIRLKDKPPGSFFRVWIAGCATGEEAFTIAILLNEALERLKKNVQIQIFATDIDEHALSIARKGVYSSAAIREFSKNICERYFTPVEDCYQIKSSIRDRVVFAKQNLTTDPPFLNLDLVTCRNVLIYFNPKLQEKVYQTLHYALGNKGILFLGRSETVPIGLGLFELVDKASKIFTRIDRRGEIPRTLPKREMTREAALVSKEKGGGIAASVSEGSELFGSIIESTFPNSVLVDEEFLVKHIFGNAGKYLTYPPGQATHSIFKIIPYEMSMELSALIRRAQKSGKAVRGRRLDGGSLAGRKLGARKLGLKTKKKKSEVHESPAIRDFPIYGIQQHVLPLNSGESRQYLVAFQEMEIEDAKVSTNGSQRKASKRIRSLSQDNRTERLEQELAATRDHLQTVVEEQVTSNEELQALNEEMQSTNEELQSSNEELETTNEELQSTNEELTTLNQELNVKSSELQTINQRFHAVQMAIVYPLVIVDHKKQLLGFNPAARTLLRLNDQDYRTHLRALTYPLDLNPVLSMLDQAIEKKTDSHFQFKTRDRSFEIQIQLLRGMREGIEGAVVSFVDNTEISSALEESRLTRERLSLIFENSPGFVKMKDLSGVYTYVNQRFCGFVGKPREDIIGRTDEEIFGTEFGKPIREHDLEVIKNEKPQEFLEELRAEGDSKTQIWMSSKFPLFDAKRRVQSICAVSLDITERIMHERQLDLFRKAISASASGNLILEATSDGFVTTFVSDQVGSTLRIRPNSLLNLNLDQLLLHLNLDLGTEQAHSIVKAMKKESNGSFILKANHNNDINNENKNNPSERWIELRSCTIKLADTGQKHLILTLFEATEQVKAQQMISAQQDELAKFNRLSALGEISAGIAPEINTPLNVIMTKTDLLRTAASKQKLNDQIAYKIATDVEQMVKNISGIVMGLKSIAGLDPEKFERASLIQIIRDTVKICEFRLHRFGVELKLDQLSSDDVIIFCCRVQIVQILINLINNSIDAISQDTEKRWISISTEQDETHAMLMLTDSGPGIEPSVAERIMTPFFTTKKAQKGTGIGLSLSRAIARHHGGDLSLVPESHHTKFKLVLPKRGPQGPVKIGDDE